MKSAVPGDYTASVPYSDLRIQALIDRLSAQPGELSKNMRLLYSFWSHFLVENFNARMFEEFRLCALEDISQQFSISFGLDCLLSFFDRFCECSGAKDMPDLFLQQFDEAKQMAQRSSLNGYRGNK